MDRALARWPADRYASASEFGAHVVQACEGQPITAPQVAVTEAKTQVLQSDPAKTSRTVAPPKTRVATAPAKSKLSPAAVGALVVVLALGGGAFAMRNSLFGGNAQDSTKQNDTTHLSGPGPTNTGDSVTQLSTSDTGAKHGGTPNGGRPTNPGGQRTDTSSHTVPPGGQQTQLNLPALRQEIFDLQDAVLDKPGQRNATRQRAQDIYGMANLPDSLRAAAAFTVYLAFFNDQQAGPARTWIDRALTLSPGNTTYLQARDGLSRLN